MPLIKGKHTAENVGKLIAQSLAPFLGSGVTPFSGVIDGGDISSVKFTEKYVFYTIDILMVISGN
jgi:hypothetical protein